MLRICLILLCLAGSAVVRANTGMPSGLAEAARREGTLLVHATIDSEQVAPLLRAFQQRYPFIRVQYLELNSADIYRRALQGNADSGDILWSSAMDLQIKLVNDGYALRYRSPQKEALPDWASWRDEVYGTTFEPVVFAYHRQRVARMPNTHADLRRMLRAQPGQNRVATYDVEASGAGYLFFSQDSRHNAEFWDLAAALGRSVRFQEGNSLTLLRRLQQGQADIAYNVLGPYAVSFARHEPQVHWVLPQDYALVVTRLMLIHKAASHTAAARLWTDFVLSREGQQVLSQGSGLPPIREDMPRRLGDIDLKQHAAKLRPIQVGSGLLVYLDTAKKSLFLKRWREQLPASTRPQN
jgi:iron(III) transport system substrate-binding protein